MPTILKDFLLMLLFKELIGSLLLLLTILMMEVERNSNRKSFLPRVDITKYNVLIGGRNVYNQPINDQIRKYDEIRKIATG